MIVIYKAPAHAPKIIRIDGSKESIREKLGGDFEGVPVLKGAMILCRKEDPALPYNVHFMGDCYRGPILLVGRGEKDAPTDLTTQLQVMLSAVLNQKERKA